MYNFFMDGLQMPVAPSELSIKINNQNETVVLMNEGEINILKKPGLTNLEFDVLLPNVIYPFAIYPNGFKPATHFLEKFEKLKVDQKPFQFIVNRMLPNGKLLFDTNMSVSIEDYEIIEEAENGFDEMVRIRLKQFRPYGTKRIKPVVSSATKATVEKNRPTIGKVSVKTHKVVPGDTLWAICKRYYGKVTLQMTNELAKRNGIKNPNLILPGQVIKL